MIYLVAMDIGFTATGITIWELTSDGYRLENLWCVKPARIKKTKKMSQADVDAAVISESARSIVEFIMPYLPMGIVAEMPTGGSKSSRATRCMGMGSAMIVTLATLMKIPCEWYTPFDIKKVVTGVNSGNKDEMMTAMADKFPELLAFPKNMMEHIADSCACWLAAQDGEMIGNLENKKEFANGTRP